MLHIVFWGMLGMGLVATPGLAFQQSDQAQNQLAKKLVIGRVETAVLSDWGIALKARIDTGAARSALHVDHIEPLAGDPQRIRFETRDQHGKPHAIEAKVVRHVRVKSSFGQVQDRPLVHTRLCLAGQEFETVVTLADRSTMRFPMLIGRGALTGRFLIDPDRRNAGRKTCSASRASSVSPAAVSSN